MQLIERPAMQENTSARQYWDAQMNKHPRIRFILNVIGSIIEFIFGGHIIVWAGYKVVMFSGRTAETALLFASLWISAIFAAHDFMTSITFGLAPMLTDLSILAFTLLPEVVLFSAIITCCIHWYQVVKNKRSAGAWIWAILYTLPTTCFFVLAVYTFCSVIYDPTHTIHAAAGLALVIRSVTSWIYCLIGLVHSGLKKFLPQMASQSEVTQAQITQQVEPAQEPVDYAALAQQIVPLFTPMVQQEVQKMATLIAHQRETENEGMLQVLQNFHDTILDEVRTLLAQNSVAESGTEDETDFALIENFEEENSVQDRDTGDLPIVRTKRNTQPLPELHTVETKQPRQSATKSDTKNSRGDAYKRAHRIAKRNPNIKPGDLAKRAEISPTYARRILSELSA